VIDWISVDAAIRLGVAFRFYGGNDGTTTVYVYDDIVGYIDVGVHGPRVRLNPGLQSAFSSGSSRWWAVTDRILTEWRQWKR
jgi:hypothetical protein